MRRTAEWLLLPLFLLPLGLGLAFHLWARADYAAELARYTESGPLVAREWLADGGPGHAFLGQFESNREYAQRLADPGRQGIHATVAFPDGSIKARDGVRVDVGGRTALVFMELAPSFFKLSPEWRLAETCPAGLTPTALADARTRLALETGRSAAAIGGLDVPSRAFRDLLDSPEVRRLAREPLPAATKRYLVRRWRSQGVTLPQLPATEEALTFLERVETLMLERRLPFSVGTHEAAGVTVLARPPLEPIFSPAGLARPIFMGSDWMEASEGPEGPVAMHYLGSSAAEPGPTLLWQGRLEAPLAGRWAFTRRFGPDWWSVPRYRRWIGTGVALLVALLFIPTALLVSMRRRRRLDEARSRFINELAHDLRTPLTSLRLYAEMLERKSSGDEERDRYASVLTRESARVTALLANLLDLSRLEDGRRHLELADVDVSQVVAQAAGDFERLFPARAADVELTGADDVRARADASALARCLANLLDNAGKYTEPGTPVRVRWRADGDEVRVAVQDEGPGIPPGERAAAFERYARGARAKSDGLPGTGLGLSLVKELLAEMGGSVRLGSSESGTEIEMRLPRGTP